jgi:N-acetylmuramoyl-L-alanine amidase
LHRLSRSVSGGAPAALRENEALLRQGSTPAGRIIVVDAGHGGPDAGCTSDLLEWSEANIAFDIATRVEGRLTALGATAFLSRPADLNMALDEQARAEFSNAAGADLVISIHADALANEAARGVATYFFGNATTHSSVGQRLAQLIQDEIVTRTDLPDGRVHGKTWDLLRWTTMPAVRVEIGYLSNPTDAARLSDPGFRDVVAEAIASGVQHLFTPESQD